MGEGRRGREREKKSFAVYCSEKRARKLLLPRNENDGESQDKTEKERKKENKIQLERRRK